MSLTLPYPDLDFVPLDVLTAEEMNQVVSNYTYISDQFPIGEASLGEAAVKSHNIDYATLGSIVSSRYNQVKELTNSPQTILTMSLPTGDYSKFMVLIEGCGFASTSTVGTMVVFPKYNGSSKSSEDVHGSFLMQANKRHSYICSEMFDKTSVSQVEILARVTESATVSIGIRVNVYIIPLH